MDLPTITWNGNELTLEQATNYECDGRMETDNLNYTGQQTWGMDWSDPDVMSARLPWMEKVEATSGIELTRETLLAPTVCGWPLCRLLAASHYSGAPVEIGAQLVHTWATPKDEYVLIPEEGGSDYTLPEGQSCWITVNNVSVYIRHTDIEASVGLYAHHYEADDALVETWLEFAEAQAYIDETEEA